MSAISIPQADAHIRNTKQSAPAIDPVQFAVLALCIYTKPKYNGHRRISKTVTLSPELLTASRACNTLDALIVLGCSHHRLPDIPPETMPKLRAESRSPWSPNKTLLQLGPASRRHLTAKYVSTQVDSLQMAIGRWANKKGRIIYAPFLPNSLLIRDMR